jgi:hypothetical protein
MAHDPNRPGVPGQDQTDPSITPKPAERDLVAEVEETLASVDDAMPRVQRAAHYRELISSLERASSAAKKLAALTPDEEEPAPEEDEEEEEGPITEPERPYRRSLALLSDGRVALSLAFVEGADLSGYERWEGIILEPDQAEEALDSMGDAAADVAAHLGGSIIWKKDEPEGGDDE